VVYPEIITRKTLMATTNHAPYGYQRAVYGRSLRLRPRRTYALRIRILVTLMNAQAMKVASARQQKNGIPVNAIVFSNFLELLALLHYTAGASKVFTYLVNIGGSAIVEFSINNCQIGFGEKRKLLNNAGAPPSLASERRLRE